MNGGAAMGGGGDGGPGGPGPGPNAPAAGQNPAEDQCVSVEHPDAKGMIDLDSGNVVLARRPAFAEEFKPEDYQGSYDPDVSA